MQMQNFFIVDLMVTIFRDVFFTYPVLHNICQYFAFRFCEVKTDKRSHKKIVMPIWYEISYLRALMLLDLPYTVRMVASYQLLSRSLRFQRDCGAVKRLSSIFSIGNC